MAPPATGTCTLCGHPTTKGAMARHLDACPARHEPDSGPIQKWLRLRVEGGGPYWLDLEAHANATVSDLDGFLRRTWLECCGHMSAFFAPGRRTEHSMRKTLLAVFAQRGAEVGYEYDFGSTTALRLRSPGGTRVVSVSAVSPQIAAWSLGAGESAVLARASANPGTWAIIDDREGRCCAVQLGIRVVGTLGLVLAATRRGIIPTARAVVKALIDSGLYLADDVVAAALALVGE